MGAYSPAPIFTEALEKEVMQEVIEPTLKGMKKRGTPYRGILYAGLMMTPQGPKVLEYNCRFGDPEAQVLLMRLKGDLIDLLDLTLKGQLNELAEEEIQNLWDPQSSVCVVMASGGYPLSYQKGFSIKGLAGVQGDGVVFHAGTRLHEGSIVNDGGRVLGVTALGENLKEAIDRAYKIVSQITWQGEFHRNDIGQKGLKGLLKD
jgi:phosphoribosylamine--glycine ligase